MLLNFEGCIFIYFRLRFYEKEVWNSVYVEYSDFYFEFFMFGKRGATPNQSSLRIS